MKIALSLFDGMSCGQIALQRAGIKVDYYLASEVDKAAIAVATRNWPDMIHLGDVREVDGTSMVSPFILMGGSPCQSFSFAGKRKGMATVEGEEITTLDRYLELKKDGFEFEGQSYLFWEYVRILRETKPKYFLLENVMMSEKWKNVISDVLEVQPILINSALVSAQNRKRLYWTNIPDITQPEDRGLLLRDIIEKGMVDREKSLCVTTRVAGATAKRYLEKKHHQMVLDGQFVDREKSFCLDANYYKGGNPEQYFSKSRRQLVFSENLELKEFQESTICHHVANATDIKGNESIKRIYAESGKSPTITAMGGGHREPKILCENVYWRKLTPLECERLQTVPENYTAHVSNSQRYKMLGNGWTVDVIAHILSHIPEEEK